MHSRLLVSQHSKPLHVAVQLNLTLISGVNQRVLGGTLYGYQWCAITLFGHAIFLRSLIELNAYSAALNSLNFTSTRDSLLRFAVFVCGYQNVLWKLSSEMNFLV
jgi:hypothetical protein